MKTILILLATSLSVQAMTLDEYMSLVMKKNKLINSYDISIEASKEKQIAGDIALSPTLTSAYSLASDKSLPSTVADKRDTQILSLGLSKKFSTGTTLSLSANTNKYEFTQPVTAGNNGYSQGGLGLTLQQSLWKDTFGNATRLRQSREELTSKLETLGYDLKKRGTLIEVESDFWDYIVAQEDLNLKKDNLDRAKKLESWTANRVYNGISDQSDLLQVKALVNLRELEFLTAQDELKSIGIKIKENIGLSEEEKVPELVASLNESRNNVQELAQNKNIIKIESYLASVEAQVKKVAADEAVDGLRPDLSLTGKYNTSSYDTDYSEMQKNITNTDRPVTYVGLSFSWLFGSDAKSSQIAATRKEALSAQSKAEQAQVSGENAWKDHLRKYELTKQNVLTLEKIAQLQRDRARAEQSKFTKGRTITSNVVNAETDSAEAEVNYLKAKSSLRKLEAATQLFMSIGE